MRKILLTIASIAVACGVQAQTGKAKLNSLPISGTNKAYVKSEAVRIGMTGNEMPLRNSNQTVAPHSSKLTGAQTIIGATTYDLQTNASISNRIINTGGNVAGTWTMSLDNTLAAPDRGTGYNYMPSGGSWGPSPFARIEAVRVGWPAIAQTPNGAEHVISHIVGQPLHYENRATAGSGSWTSGALAAIGPPEVLWGRMAANNGGPNGNSLHVICISLPVANSGAIYNGLDGCPLYYRSQDGGATWDVVGAVPTGVDSLGYFGWSADAYAIDAKGSTVAFCHGQIDEDWAMWKSTDNGTTWTKTIIYDFPFTRYDDVNEITDVDGDGIGDTVLTTDHKVAILIDNNGMVHCWAGAVFILDDVLADPLGIFLSTDGLQYWNESMGANPPVVIANTPDLDGDGQLTFAADYVPRYGNGGQTSQPDAAIDAGGIIIVSFVAPVENTSSGNPSPLNFSYRNTWMIGSADGGITWTAPVLAAGSNFDEAVFSAIARDINNNCIDLMWQQDGLPGVAVQPPITGDQTSHPFGNNDIVHDCISVNAVLGIENSGASASSFTLYPNPAKDVVEVQFNLKKIAPVKVDIMDVTGKLAGSQVIKPVSTGDVSYRISLSAYDAGVYMMKVTIDGSSSVSRLVIE